MKQARVLKGAAIAWSAGLMAVIILVKVGAFDDALYPVTQSLQGSPNGSPLLATSTDTLRTDTTLADTTGTRTSGTDTSWMTSPTAPIPANAFPNWREFLERETMMTMASSKSMTIAPRRYPQDSNSAKKRMRQAHIDSLNNSAWRRTKDSSKRNR